MNEIRTAAGDYHCNASEYVNEMLGREDVTPAEWRSINSAMRENWVIKAGTKYHYTEGVFYGIPYTSRCRLDMHGLCIKYDLYGE